MIQYGYDPRFTSLYARVGERWWKVRAHPGLGRVILERASSRTDTDNLQPLTSEQLDMVMNIGGRPRPAGKELDVAETTKATSRIAEIFGFDVKGPKPALVQGYVGVVGDKDKSCPGGFPVVQLSRKLGDYVRRRRRGRRSYSYQTEQAIESPTKEGDTAEIVRIQRVFLSDIEPLTVTKVRLNAFGRPGMGVCQVMAMLSRAEAATCAVARMLQTEFGVRIEVLPDGSARRETKGGRADDEWAYNRAA